jgi:hypothetical protein
VLLYSINTRGAFALLRVAKAPNKSLTIIIIYLPNGSSGPGILTRYLSKSKPICMNQSKLLLAALFAIVAGFYSCSKTGNTGATGVPEQRTYCIQTGVH